MFPEAPLYGQTQKGAVSGTVFDAQTSRPVIGVEILVNGQGSDRQKTGTDGNYRLELSPGKYTLKFAQENYFPVELTNVDVKAGEAVDGSTVMTAKGATTTVEVKESVSAGRTGPSADRQRYRPGRPATRQASRTNALAP